MYKGIYIALSGAVLKQRQMDLLTQNLANADTVGYKKEAVTFQDYLLAPAGAGTNGRDMAMLASQNIDFSNGSLVQTGNPLDVAIEGKAFIALEGGRYTRRGDLRRDTEGYLTTYDGVKVLGSSGPIQLPEGVVDIRGSGAIFVKEITGTTTEVDTIMLREFPDPASLTKVGGGMFTAASEGVESSSFLQQGAVERSNVDTITEMVRMIESLREFESYQKMMQAFDEATAKVNNEIARM
jgi:flagellar basal-body rod protein FlgG